MKKLIASASLVAVGAAGLHGANAPGLSRTQTSKPWSVSATLRGFYDDNYATTPSNPSPGTPEKEDSFGFEIAPSAAVNFPMQQTYVGASYRYSLKYYEAREDNNSDQTHEARVAFDHRFSPRYDLYANEYFIYAQEPDLIDPSLGSPTRIRTDSSGIRNQFVTGLNASLTELVGLGFAYRNGYFNYDDEGDGSRSAQLDRFEHLINLDGRYKAREDMTGLLGYQFGSVAHTSDDYLFSGVAPALNTQSDERDSTSHYFYLGADGNISSTVAGNLRAGVQYTEFSDLDEDSLTPYFLGTVTWTYSPGSSLEVGLTHRRNATDVTGSPGTSPADRTDNITTDQVSTSLYASVNHRITPKLSGDLLAQVQRSTFNEGPFDDEHDDFLLFGGNLEYQINQFLSAEAGYNFDRLSSDLEDRSYTRNRVFVGIRATY